jgi:hypothetical protein
MFDGTLVTRGPWEALVTFQQMLVLCDAEGFIDMTPEVISRRTTIPLEIIKKGIAALEQPDPDSRLSAEEGRRIIRIADHRNWGWQIVNHAYYRNLQSNEERREYMRSYQRNRRAKLTDEEREREYDRKRVNKRKPVSTVSTSVSSVTDTEAEAEAKRTTTSAPNGKISFDAAGVGWDGITSAHMRVWSEAYPAVNLNAELNSAAAWMVANPKNRKSNYGRFLTNWLKRAQDRAPARGGGQTEKRFVV